MQLSLLKEKVIYTCSLPNKRQGQYWINQINIEGYEEQLISVEGIDGQWVFKSNRNAHIVDINLQREKEKVVEPMQLYRLHLTKTNEIAILFAEPITKDRKAFTKLLLPEEGSIYIGRAEGSDLLYDNKYTSSNHAEIVISSNKLEIIDNKSANGTYVNGERVTGKRGLNAGDIIYIIGFKIIVGNGYISINNPDGKVSYNHNLFSSYQKSQVMLTEEDYFEDELIGHDLFYRSPRFKRDIEKKNIKIDPPPAQDNSERTPLMLMLGPSITMGMASLSMGAFTLYNTLNSNGNMMNAMPMLTMSFSMLLGMILWPILTRRYEGKRKEKREKLRQEKYKQYIQSIRIGLSELSDEQSNILHENYVSLHDCINRIQAKQRNLWERTHRQDDFLKLRLGLGNLPLVANITYPEKRFTLEDDDLQKELYELAEKPKLLENVPISISLTDDWVSGIIGNREQVIKLVKGLIVQLVSLHSYDELKLVFIYNTKEQNVWNFVKWLPHIWQHDTDIRLLATNTNEIKELNSFIEKEFSLRKSISNDQDLKDITPHYVIFTLDKGLSIKSEAINNVIKEKKNYGISVVNVYDELKDLPKECSIVVEYSDYEVKMFDKDDITGQSIVIQPDILLGHGEDELAIKLANIKLDASTSSNSLPNMLTFLDMFEVGKIEHLNALTRWKENDPTLSLDTPIGVVTSGEKFYLDLHEKFHGPHGLIAGMTGSGKSEFIMTYILSLAVNYHPYEVAFILIDYKGGGMANAFAKLPHLAGTITNLDGSAVERSLVSIQSELKRRQTLFNEESSHLSVSNMDIYKYQKLFREGKVKEPLQHLFIISDEFAELKTQQPEFMKQLVSAARIGRSLGIHLILATQKPSGVVDDEIWSNSSFRISLKVQEKADSMDVIKRPDAAELSVTGRFYVQVGYNELFELGQSAWAGAPYYPSDRLENRNEHFISIIDNLGRVLKQTKLDTQRVKPPKLEKQIDKINEYLSSIAAEENIKVRPLWLEPIPALIYLDELYRKYPQLSSQLHEIDPIIGEIDDPVNQRKFALTYPLTREGNSIVFGAAGSGDTLFISTLIYSIMQQYTPDKIHIYIMDFGAETLRAYANAPHVGDVMLLHDTEKINNLWNVLYKEITRRKKLFSEYGGDIHNYLSHSGETLESILVIIHNYTAFVETYEENEEKIAYLTREGIKYGIYFLVTVQSTGGIKYRIQQNFKQSYVLQMNDHSDYTAILGNINGVYPAKTLGRGIVKKDKTYEYQIAHIKDDISNVFGFISHYCTHYANTWEGTSASRIPILPQRVDVDYLLKDPASKLKTTIPIGIEPESLKVINVRYDQQFIQYIMSQDNSHLNMVQGLAEVIFKMADTKLIVFDPLQIITQVGDYEYKLVSQVEQLERLVVELFDMMVFRNNTYKDAIAAGASPPQFEKLTYIFTSYKDLSSKLSMDAKDKLMTLLQKGLIAYTINIIISENSNNISHYSYEEWFKNNVNLKEGIWIGNGITNHYYFKLDKVPSNLYNEIDKQFGYIIHNGKPSLVKLVTTVTDSEDEFSG